MFNQGTHAYPSPLLYSKILLGSCQAKTICDPPKSASNRPATLNDRCNNDRPNHRFAHRGCSACSRWHLARAEGRKSSARHRLVKPRFRRWTHTQQINKPHDKSRHFGKLSELASRRANAVAAGATDPRIPWTFEHRCPTKASAHQYRVLLHRPTRLIGRCHASKMLRWAFSKDESRL
jgi:hypothetical protein